MDWTDDLIALKEELCDLYPTKEDSHTIVREALLPFKSIAFQDKAENNWSEILEVANRHGKVLNIIRVALKLYPQNGNLLALNYSLAIQTSIQSIPKIGIKIRYLYTPEDAKYQDELAKRLSLMVQNQLIEMLSSHTIASKVVNTQDQAATEDDTSISLWLIGSNFIYSDRLQGTVVQRVLDRHLLGEEYLILILLYPARLENTPLSSLPSLPRNAMPVSTWENKDLAFEDIAMGVRKAVTASTFILGPQKGLISSGAPQNQNILLARKQVNSEIIASNSLQTISPHFSSIAQELEEFRRCQGEVSELKEVHNMLHEVERELEGLTATIQLKLEFSRKENKPSFLSSKIALLLGDETNAKNYSIDELQIFWTNISWKIDKVIFFAAEEMKFIHNERFSYDNSSVRGPEWAKELLLFQISFKASLEGKENLKEKNLISMKTLSQEHLQKCRIHLYQVDRQLLQAVKRLDQVSEKIWRAVTYGTPAKDTETNT